MRTCRKTNIDSFVDEGHLYLRQGNWNEFSQWFEDRSDEFWRFNQTEFLEALTYQNILIGILNIKASKLFRCIFPVLHPKSWHEAVKSFVKEIKKRAIYNEATLDFAIYLYDEDLNDFGAELVTAFFKDEKFEEKADGYIKFICDHPSENAGLFLWMFADRQGSFNLYMNDFVSRLVEFEGSSEEDLTELFEQGPEVGSSRLV